MGSPSALGTINRLCGSRSAVSGTTTADSTSAQASALRPAADAMAGTATVDAAAKSLLSILLIVSSFDSYFQ